MYVNAITKSLLVYKYITLYESTLLYGSEDWTVYRVTANKTNTFLMRQLQQILNIKQGIIFSIIYYNSLHKAVGLCSKCYSAGKSQHDEYV